MDRKPVNAMGRRISLLEDISELSVLPYSSLTAHERRQ